MSTTECSVIIPVYNGEATIAPCLQSLLDQEDPGSDYEIVVVDDGSTDGTAGVVQQFPVRYLYQPNRGPASARNRGAKEAKGDILIFTDADCAPQHDWLRQMLRAFADESVTAVKGVYRTRQRSLAARFAQGEFEERYRMLADRHSIDFVDTYSAAFRREPFLEAGGFDTSFPVANNEDTELSYRLAEKGLRMVFAPDAIVYHHHPDSLREYARQKFWRGYWRIEAYRRHPRKAIKDSYTPQALKGQVLLAGLLACSLPLLAIRPGIGVLVAGATGLLFLVSCLPFWLFSLRTDPLVGIAAPGLLLVRAFSIGLGVLRGLTVPPNRA